MSCDVGLVGHYSCYMMWMNCRLVSLCILNIVFCLHPSCRPQRGTC